MRILHVAPIQQGEWVLTLDEDASPPISSHPTRGEAETAARAYAQTFGYPQVVVHHENGEISHMRLDSDPPAPQPGGPRGDFAA